MLVVGVLFTCPTDEADRTAELSSVLLLVLEDGVLLDILTELNTCCVLDDVVAGESKELLCAELATDVSDGSGQVNFDASEFAALECTSTAPRVVLATFWSDVLASIAMLEVIFALDV